MEKIQTVLKTLKRIYKGKSYKLYECKNIDGSESEILISVKNKTAYNEVTLVVRDVCKDDLGYFLRFENTDKIYLLEYR
jgi:hypothetical protein